MLVEYPHRWGQSIDQRSLALYSDCRGSSRAGPRGVVDFWSVLENFFLRQRVTACGKPFGGSRGGEKGYLYKRKCVLTGTTLLRIEVSSKSQKARHAKDRR